MWVNNGKYTIHGSFGYFGPGKRTSLSEEHINATAGNQPYLFQIITKVSLRLLYVFYTQHILFKTLECVVVETCHCCTHEASGDEAPELHFSPSIQSLIPHLLPQFLDNLLFRPHPKASWSVIQNLMKFWTCEVKFERIPYQTIISTASFTQGHQRPTCHVTVATRGNRRSARDCNWKKTCESFKTLEWQSYLDGIYI